MYNCKILYYTTKNKLQFLQKNTQKTTNFNDMVK